MPCEDYNSQLEICGECNGHYCPRVKARTEMTNAISKKVSIDEIIDSVILPKDVHKEFLNFGTGLVYMAAKEPNSLLIRTRK
jgi:hypothetical protein